jgi:GT2 family glycosyltransferase
MSKDLTISIVNYNHKEFILRCLGSIYSCSDGLDLDIYVVDNHSSDGSVDMIRRSYPDVNLIMNGENRGFAKGNNQVLRIFQSRYCLITNPDIIILPGTLQEMVSFMDSNSDAGIIGCKLLNTDRSLQYSCRRYPTIITLLSRGLLVDSLFPKRNISKKYLMMDVSHDGIIPVNWLTGCCLMVRKETIQQIGLMDENYFLYFEDVDLCYRVNQKWKVYYLSHVQMIHEFQHTSRRIGGLKHKFYHTKSALHFFKKHGLFLNRGR